MKHRTKIESVMEKIFIVLAAPMLLLLMGGVFCGCAAQTLRFEPTEPQKEAADGTSRLAAGGAVTGSRPFSPMAKEMARMAATLTAYTGTPSMPIDIMPFLEAESNAWDTIEKQRDGYKSISEILRTSNYKVIEKFGELIARVSATKNQVIKVEELLPMMHELSGWAEFSESIVSKYKIPEDEETTAEVNELVAQIKGIVEKAQVDAARRPTGKDVSDEVRNQVLSINEEAQNWLGTVQGIADEWGVGGVLTGLLGAVGIGGVAVRGRSKIKKIESATDETAKEKDKELADKNIELAKVKGENDSLYDQVRELSKKLAEAPSSLAKDS